MFGLRLSSQPGPVCARLVYSLLARKSSSLDRFAFGPGPSACLVGLLVFPPGTMLPRRGAACLVLPPCAA